mmetsp:Transcript_7849/g.19230  ORF Transcript_7849/g.19230 Transcript_7849/m.19230 type:complete len:330 (-) Transcript_7849:5-994(-)
MYLIPLQILLTDGYLGLFDEVWAWWLMSTLMLVLLVSYLCVGEWWYTLAHGALGVTPLTPAAGKVVSASDACNARIQLMHAKGYRWTFGISFFLANRKSFTVFDRALSSNAEAFWPLFGFFCTTLVCVVTAAGVTTWFLSGVEEMTACEDRKQRIRWAMAGIHTTYSYLFGKAAQALLFGSVSLARGCVGVDCWNDPQPFLALLPGLLILGGCCIVGSAYIEASWMPAPTAKEGETNANHGSLCMCPLCHPPDPVPSQDDDMGCVLDEGCCPEDDEQPGTLRQPDPLGVVSAERSPARPGLCAERSPSREGRGALGRLLDECSGQDQEW